MSLKGGESGGKRRVSRHFALVAGLRSTLLLVIILGALLGQSIVVRSHVHFTENRAGGPTHVDAIQVSDQTPIDPVADCPLCAELATSGDYLSPDPIVLPKTLLPLLWLFVLPATVISCRARSHRWQSRAPPQ